MTLAFLPTELVQLIGQFCDHRQLAALSLLNHAFHDIFNPLLYRYNILHQDPYYACVRWAAEHGSLDTLKLAFAYGADIDITGAEKAGPQVLSPLADDDPDRGYAAPLHLAIDSNHPDIVRWLLDHGASLDAMSWQLCWDHEDDFGWYPLHFAIRHSTGEEMLSLLLERRACYSARGILGLRCAIEHASLPAVDALLRQDSFDPDHRDNEAFTALHYVADCEDPAVACQIIHRLVDCGVPLDVVGNYGGTAITRLVTETKFKPAIALLQRGADPTVSDWGDRGLGMLDRCFDEAYSYAIDNAEDESKAAELREDRQTLVSLLISRGIDVNRRLGHGAAPYSRPLFWALTVGRDAHCVRLLLDAGASIKDAFVQHDTSPQAESILRVFFRMFSNVEPVPPKTWDPIRGSLKPYKESLRLLLERGARIDFAGGAWSALSKTCEMAGTARGTEPLGFLVENSTCRNVELEYVEVLKGDWRRDEAVYALLETFYNKLVKERESETYVEMQG
ncbi:hypothetical protein ACJ41O_000373 [Fusarium nematophilum]